MLMKDCTEEKLKPCPFCGGKAETDYGCFRYESFFVYCLDCGAYLCDPNIDSEKGVIEKWNKRIYEE